MVRNITTKSARQHYHVCEFREPGLRLFDPLKDHKQRNHAEPAQRTASKSPKAAGTDGRIVGVKLLMRESVTSGHLVSTPLEEVTLQIILQREALQSLPRLLAPGVANT